MKMILIVSALVFTLMPLSAIVHKIGDFDTPGIVNSMTASGNYLYLADGDSGLLIFDISDPSNPILLGTYRTPGEPSCVAVAGNIAYVADIVYGLSMIDVSDPQHPLLLGSCWTSYASSVAVSGNLAYVAYRSGLVIIDITDPQNSFVTGFCATPGEARSVAVSGNAALLACGDSGLQIIDITNPQNPVLLGSYTDNSAANFVATVGGLAYVVFNGSESYLQILDVTDPQNPVELGGYSTWGFAYSVAVVNGLAYLTDGASYFLSGGGVRIINVSNPQSCQAVGSYVTQHNVISVAVANNTAYLGSDNTDTLMQIIDVSNTQNQAILGYYNTPSGSAVTVVGSISYEASEQGLWTNNVFDPLHVTQLDWYDTPGDAVHVAVEGNLAYVADGNSGLRIIDATDPDELSLAGFCDTPGYAGYVAVSGSYTYIADGESGLQVIDATNPQNPILVGWCDTPSDASSIAISGNHAYVADGDSGLQIIDVSNPQDPAWLGALDTPGDAQSVAVLDNTAFVADGSGGLQIIDVSNPILPGLISSLLPHSTSYVNRCYIHEGYLYFSDNGWNEIWIYNISLLPNLILRNQYGWNRPTTDMSVANGKLYTLYGDAGIYIHDLATIPVQADDAALLPVPAFNLRNYPNPFNPETTISYCLSTAGQVRLDIYNSRGQLVKHLWDAQQAAGKYDLTWSGTDCSGNEVTSGLYFCRIASSGKHEMKKMLLLK